MGEGVELGYMRAQNAKRHPETFIFIEIPIDKAQKQTSKLNKKQNNTHTVSWKTRWFSVNDQLTLQGQNNM